MKSKPPTALSRPTWQGFLQLNLISIPVNAYSAKVKRSRSIDLDWLHRDCHHRIHYQKICPVHGPVSNEEIISGYEAEKGQYVILESEELASLRTKRQKTISLDAIFPADAIDCFYHTDKSYYLLPDGDVAEKPYAVLQQAMNQEKCHALAQVVLFKRDQLVLVRPMDRLLVMTSLSFLEEFVAPSAFSDHLPHVKVAGRQIDLAGNLIKSMAEEGFDFASYKDEYIDKLKALIETKAKGKAIAISPEEEEPAPTLNFEEALKKSLARSRKPQPGRRGARRQARKKVS